MEKVFRPYDWEGRKFEVRKVSSDSLTVSRNGCSINVVNNPAENRFDLFFSEGGDRIGDEDDISRAINTACFHIWQKLFQKQIIEKNKKELNTQVENFWLDLNKSTE